jgi:hypothetical protein
MKSILPVLIAAFAAGPVLAQEAAEAPAPEPLQIFRDGDAAMTCVQISDEAAALSEQFGGDQGGGVFSSVVNVGRAGASLLIPGAGLALAGADALTRPERERREAHEQALEQRWYYLNGLYTGLRCNQTQAAVQTEVPAAAPAAVPAVVIPPPVRP